jgi:TnsA endonuclease N terminal
MASKFARGKFQMKHPEKYIGTKVPTYRSSWEWSFMNFCDNNKSVQKWASEAIQIPYKDPLTGRQTVYVPDFFIQYVDKNSKMIVELIEIKPSSQQIIERVGKNKYNQAQFIKNQAKWTAANLWCKQQGIRFRILNENDLFHTGTA